MSDARWFEIDLAVDAAIRHFNWSVSFYARLSNDQPTEDRHLVEMAFMHAMQSGYTSLEVALLRILDVCHEAPPTGATWHADLIRRVTNGVSGRPPILTGDVALAADITRKFRHVATHVYDSLDYTKAAEAVDNARTIAAHLTDQIAAFRVSVDP